MKQIIKYSLNDEIPGNATFLFYDRYDNKNIKNIYYEVPIYKESERVVKDPHTDTVKLVIDYLNKRVGSKYTYKSKTTTGHIRARLNEGRTYPDFMQVINKKANEWLDDPQFNQYLRPATLFGSKFDGYLSQKTSVDMEAAPFDELDKLMDGHA